MKRKFNIEVTRVDEYEIEIDDKVWNKAALEEWGSVFFHVSDVSDIATQLAIATTREGSGGFIEGFGYVETTKGSGYKLSLPKDQLIAKGIKLKIISEDENYEHEIL